MAKRRRTFRLQPFVVYYAWIEDGVEKRAHTCEDGFDKHDAGKRFQKKNKHVVVVDSILVPDDPASALNIGTRIREMALSGA